MCQPNSSISSPTSNTSFPKPAEFVNTPALFFPKATIIAPVNVDNSSMVFTRYFSCTQLMQSASTNRPYASVLPISTVSPFLDCIMSKGLQLLALMKFSANPNTATTLRFSFSRTALQKALNTEQAPCLSLCIPEIPDVGLRFRPPASKQSPLPTKLTNCSLSGAPRHQRATKNGSFVLARPTACNSLNPYFSNYSPLMTLSLTSGFSFAIF